MRKHSHPVESCGAADATRRLKALARKVTGPRKALLDILNHEEHPLTIKELHSRMPVERCDLGTVYRSIRMVEEAGLVNRFEFGDGVARYELVREADHGHHHHLICRDCSKVVEIEDCFPSELEDRIASGNGFKAITHRLEFFGICPSCQAE